MEWLDLKVAMPREMCREYVTAYADYVGMTAKYSQSMRPEACVLSLSLLLFGSAAINGDILTSHKASIDKVLSRICDVL